MCVHVVPVSPCLLCACKLLFLPAMVTAFSFLLSYPPSSFPCIYHGGIPTSILLQADRDFLSGRREEEEGQAHACMHFSVLLFSHSTIWFTQPSDLMVVPSPSPSLLCWLACRTSATALTASLPFSQVVTHLTFLKHASKQADSDNGWTKRQDVCAGARQEKLYRTDSPHSLLCITSFPDKLGIDPRCLSRVHFAVCFERLLRRQFVACPLPWLFGISFSLPLTLPCLAYTLWFVVVARA